MNLGKNTELTLKGGIQEQYSDNNDEILLREIINFKISLTKMDEKYLQQIQKKSKNALKNKKITPFENYRLMGLIQIEQRQILMDRVRARLIPKSDQLKGDKERENNLQFQHLTKNSKLNLHIQDKKRKGEEPKQKQQKNTESAQNGVIKESEPDNSDVIMLRQILDYRIFLSQVDDKFLQQAQAKTKKALQNQKISIQEYKKLLRLIQFYQSNKKTQEMYERIRLKADKLKREKNQREINRKKLQLNTNNKQNVHYQDTKRKKEQPKQKLNDLDNHGRKVSQTVKQSNFGKGNFFNKIAKYIKNLKTSYSFWNDKEQEQVSLLSSMQRDTLNDSTTVKKNK